MINRKSFYDLIRPFFGGKIDQSQVDGIECILTYWDDQGYKDLRWLAYILATAYHETAKTMEPVKEYGRGKGHPYGEPDVKTGKTYYGRGYVQLTWSYNYAKFSKILGIDLLNDPELACDKSVAVKILFTGMINGMFTGKGLAKYFNEEQTDWIEARRIINGKDRAELIGKYAVHFHNALV